MLKRNVTKLGTIFLCECHIIFNCRCASSVCVSFRNSKHKKATYKIQANMSSGGALKTLRDKMQKLRMEVDGLNDELNVKSTELERLNAERDKVGVP